MENQIKFANIYNAYYSQMLDAGDTAAADALNDLARERKLYPGKDPELAAKAQEIVNKANIKYSQANNPAREYMDSNAPVRTEWGFTDEGLAKALGPTLGGKDLYSYE